MSYHPHQLKGHVILLRIPPLGFQDNAQVIDLPSVDNDLEWYGKFLKECFGGVDKLDDWRG